MYKFYEQMIAGVVSKEEPKYGTVEDLGHGEKAFVRHYSIFWDGDHYIHSDAPIFPWRTEHSVMVRRFGDSVHPVKGYGFLPKRPKLLENYHNVLWFGNEVKKEAFHYDLKQQAETELSEISRRVQEVKKLLHKLA